MFQNGRKIKLNRVCLRNLDFFLHFVIQFASMYSMIVSQYV